MSSLKRNSSNVMRRSRRGPPRGRTPTEMPPQINVVPRSRHTFRFVATSTFTGNINSNDLLAVPGGVTIITNNTIRGIASSMRIHRISIFPASGSYANIAWFDGVHAQDIELNQDQPLGTTLPTVVSSSPPSGTLTADWFNSGLNAIIVGLLVPIGSVVDVDLEWTTTNSYVGVNVNIVTGPQGTFYYGYLDGTTSHKLQPVGLPNTF